MAGYIPTASNIPGATEPLERIAARPIGPITGPGANSIISDYCAFLENTRRKYCSGITEILNNDDKAYIAGSGIKITEADIAELVAMELTLNQATVIDCPGSLRNGINRLVEKGYVIGVAITDEPRHVHFNYRLTDYAKDKPDKIDGRKHYQDIKKQVFKLLEEGKLRD